MKKNLWHKIQMVSQEYHILNIHHPHVEKQILQEMERGVDVYYDTRWKVSQVLCEFLLTFPHWVKERSVLVLGAGIGMESVIIGKLARQLYVNDLAPIALELSAKQLEKNHIYHYQLCPGQYQNVPFPKVDIAIGSFLVYDKQTFHAMQTFLDHFAAPVMLINDTLSPLQELLQKSSRRRKLFLQEEGYKGILFHALE